LAVGAGAASDLITTALEAGAEVFITSDVQYHEARSATEMGLSLIDVDHFFAERLVLPRLKELVKSELDVPLWISDVITSPFAKQASFQLGPNPTVQAWWAGS
jgi:putative NIF3 family GTP cyclohydrolase 1 type 2